MESLVFRLPSPPLVICNRIITVIRIRVVELKLDLEEKALLSIVSMFSRKREKFLLDLVSKHLFG